MKFKITYLNEIIPIFNKTALFAAVEKENFEIVKLLLTENKIDVNILNIFHKYFFLFDSKLNNSIQFQNH